MSTGKNVILYVFSATATKFSLKCVTLFRIGRTGRVGNTGRATSFWDHMTDGGIAR